MSHYLIVATLFGCDLSTKSRSQCKRLDLVELVGGGMFATLKKETPMTEKYSLYKILQAPIYP